MSEAGPPGLEPPEGRFIGRAHHFPLRVYFEDTDLSGIVYHANYLRFMERARSEMLRILGTGHAKRASEDGTAYAVTDVRLKYRRPARLDDSLMVVSELIALRAASCRIRQRVMRGGECLVEAEILTALVDRSGRPQRQPAEWISIFAPYVVDSDG